MRKFLFPLLFLLAMAGIVAAYYLKMEYPAVAKETAEKQVIKVGYFPNITHSQALVGISNGIFQKFLGDNITIKTIIFNAGPSEIEALFAGEIDIGYIGPSPAINGYIKSRGEALKIISGATSGGASLVVQPEIYSLYQKENDQALEGRKISSPQQGNTHDISLRHYLKEKNLLEKTQVVPIANADQLTMFVQKQLDGAWAPEPWASRLIIEAGGKRIIDERDLWPEKKFCTANVIVSTEFLKEHPDLVKKWLAGHLEVTNWIKANSDEARQIVNAEIEKLTTKKLPEDVLKEAWQMIDVDIDPVKDSVFTFADWAADQGFLGDQKPDLINLYDLSILNEVANTKY
ncbi:sulfate ABC transporter substrate-binding protein [Candidatus Falkowbacteria bacterium CG10_big_fil_rev_8_21_14_0_10_43_10]|uniref:Sulfate ABC transporter substrate-binding protein n=1 Tax=Candidatus Falkowbacteria bacterium CG10_big_fil_rev_8_21_14_0_10_43_10 TaxID=1974567 RepID=A0A2H0V1Z4_9BACT|nr:MAG: sulfate ABC transporter substrate-binding protein [Candidatus Falkowbacteria bacterium CG10_big_fil_rev_8_21_14_0_10_43_10]